MGSCMLSAAARNSAMSDGAVSRASAILRAMCGRGPDLPSSICDTVTRATPARSANACCDMRRRSRASRSVSITEHFLPSPRVSCRAGYRRPGPPIDTSILPVTDCKLPALPAERCPFGFPSGRYSGQNVVVRDIVDVVLDGHPERSSGAMFGSMALPEDLADADGKAVTGSRKLARAGGSGDRMSGPRPPVSAIASSVEQCKRLKKGAMAFMLMLFVNERWWNVATEAAITEEPRDDQLTRHNAFAACLIVNSMTAVTGAVLQDTAMATTLRPS